jgi:hypothetical protein
MDVENILKEHEELVKEYCDCDDDLDIKNENMEKSVIWDTYKTNDVNQLIKENKELLNKCNDMESVGFNVIDHDDFNFENDDIYKKNDVSQFLKEHNKLLMQLEKGHDIQHMKSTKKLIFDDDEKDNTNEKLLMAHQKLVNEYCDDHLDIENENIEKGGMDNVYKKDLIEDQI